MPALEDDKYTLPLDTTNPAKESTRLARDEKLLNAQLYIQNNLEKDLSLHTVSREVGISASHFHRLFRSQAGETLKTYVDRLRVEKSLYDIRITDLNLLQIAHRYGFKNPETYSRVFMRHMGCLPSDYLKERSMSGDSILEEANQPLSISDGLRKAKASGFSITRLSRLHLAFMRHKGPYENVPLFSSPGSTIWTKLAAFVETNQLTAQPAIHIGIPQDSPGTTPSERLRYDACQVVTHSFHPRGRIGYQLLPAGYYGVITHAGSYASLAGAYRTLFQSAQALSNFEIVSSPIFELLLDISAMTIKDHTWTELYVPLKRKGSTS